MGDGVFASMNGSFLGRRIDRDGAPRGAEGRQDRDNAKTSHDKRARETSPSSAAVTTRERTSNLHIAKDNPIQCVITTKLRDDQKQKNRVNIRNERVNLHRESSRNLQRRPDCLAL
jgi:hypothetical protein